MKFFKIPNQLWILTLALTMSVPLLMLNISVFEKTPVWKIFSIDNIRLLLLHFAWVLITLRLLLKAKWLSLWSFGLMSGVTLYSNVFFLFRYKNYGLAFFALAFLIFSIFFAVHLYQLLSMAYYQAGKRWFEGMPRFIPQLQANVISDGKKVPARLSRLGEEGCFLFLKEPIKNPTTVVMSLGDKSIKCSIKLVTETKNGIGMGMMFKVENQDQWKDLNDFIHRVKCFGYI